MLPLRNEYLCLPHSILALSHRSSSPGFQGRVRNPMNRLWSGVWMELVASYSSTRIILFVSSFMASPNCVKLILQRVIHEE